MAKLHDKYKQRYAQTPNSKLSEVRDLPPISGEIIWARQLERQLDSFLRRAQFVLGKGWEHHTEGRLLKEDGDRFRAMLNPRQLFERWSNEVQARRFDTNFTGPIFDIELRRGVVPRLVLEVNFNPQIISLAKEVRNLKWMGFPVPLTIVSTSVQARRFYPMAISLKASLRTYQLVLNLMDERPELKPLMAGDQKKVQDDIAEGIQLKWETYRSEALIAQLSADVTNLQERLDDLVIVTKELEASILTLEDAHLAGEHSVTSKLEKIQAIVDDLLSRKYSNLDLWVAMLNQAIEIKLGRRLVTAVRDWCTALREYGRDPRDIDRDPLLEPLPTITPAAHEIQIKNQNVSFVCVCVLMCVCVCVCVDVCVVCVFVYVCLCLFVYVCVVCVFWCMCVCCVCLFGFRLFARNVVIMLFTHKLNEYHINQSRCWSSSRPSRACAST